MGFWRDLIFGAPKQNVLINPNTRRPYTREEISRINYQRQFGQRGMQRTMQPNVARVQQKRSFLGEMFSTTYTGPMPKPAVKKNGPGFMGRMRQSAMWSSILRR